MTAFARIWKAGVVDAHEEPLHVSMNDFLIHDARDIPRVAIAGMRFRRAWPETDGAVGLWVASNPSGRRQISVSVWRDAAALLEFVRSPAHLQVMRDFRGAGNLITTKWAVAELDRAAIWRQAEDRLLGRLPGALHN